MQKRNDFFDIAKGIAILLVVIGHAIQYFSEDWQTNPLFLCIIMFHMPLFMAISGYFLYPSIGKKGLRTYTMDKARQLLLPSCIYGATTVALLIANDIIDGRQIASCNYVWSFLHGLWYLVALFIVCIFASAAHRTCKGGRSLCLMWLIMCIAIQFTPSDLVLNGLKTLLPFAAIAIGLRQHNWENVPWYVACLSLVVFWGCYVNYSFDDSMYAITMMAVDAEYWRSFLVRAVAGASGVIVTLYIARCFARVPVANKVLASLGRVTLPIYVLQSYIFFAVMFSHITIPSIALRIIIGVFITATAVGGYEVLKRYRNIRLLIFGQK